MSFSSIAAPASVNLRTAHRLRQRQAIAFVGNAVLNDGNGRLQNMCAGLAAFGQADALTTTTFDYPQLGE